MAAPANAEDVVRLVRRSELVDDSVFAVYLQRLADAGAWSDEPKPLISQFVRDGVLTLFQAEQLLLGKFRGFAIGKYRILERLGYGGMGQVFLCEHQFMRRRVAIKVLPPVKAKDQAALARFYREARATAALDHSNIVRSHDVDQDGRLHFLVMEFVDGVSLLALVRKVGPLDISRACEYVRQAAQGLQHAHQAGLVHRDMKPGNLMVDREGTVKILDLGLARFRDDVGEPLTATRDEPALLGTADYIAPEQALNGHEVDIRADIYALGGTLYFLLTGQPPFPEGNIAEKLLAHQERTPRPIRELRHVPTALVAVIEKMMAKDVAQRFATPGDVAEALRPLVADLVPPPALHELPKLSPAARASSEPGRVPVVIGGGLSEPFNRALARGSNASSLSQFNLPSSAAGSRSASRTSGSRHSGSRTETKVSGRLDETPIPTPRSRSSPKIAPPAKPAEVHPPVRWLILVAIASALGACLGIFLWSRLSG